MNAVKGRRRGFAFTLTELLTVVMIIMILMGILLGAVGAIRKNTYEVGTKAVMANLQAALISYKLEFGEYPVSDPDQLIDDSGVLGMLVNSRHFRPDPNFLVNYSFPVWQASTIYQPHSKIAPSPTPGLMFRVVEISGTSGTTDAALWSKTPGTIIEDNELVWECFENDSIGETSGYRLPSELISWKREDKDPFYFTVEMPFHYRLVGKSGTLEPIWPKEKGGPLIQEESIKWECYYSEVLVDSWGEGFALTVIGDVLENIIGGYGAWEKDYPYRLNAPEDTDKISPIDISPRYSFICVGNANTTFSGRSSTSDRDSLYWENMWKIHFPPNTTFTEGDTIWRPFSFSPEFEPGLVGSVSLTSTGSGNEIVIRME